MNKTLFIFLILAGFSCNPYQPYYFTHYHITASYDPASTSLSANVKMVFVPGRAYHDSIVFRLNEHMTIQSLSAQELKYYEFENGRIVMYIEEAAMPGDQLHISMTYRGKIGPDPGVAYRKRTGSGQLLSPDDIWYPVNSGTEMQTYAVDMKLPDKYELGAPAIRKGRHWHWVMEQPTGSIAAPGLKE
jgi:hypothetical protein